MTRIVERIREKGLAGSARALFRRLGTEPSDSVGLPDAWSEYLSWLSLANAGMMDRGNVAGFDYAMRHLPSASPIVEIGSFCGLSTNTLTYLKRIHGRSNSLITCDKWIFEGSESGGTLDETTTVTHADYRLFVKQSFERNVRTFSGNDLPFTIEVFSDEFFDLWSEASEARDVFGRQLRLGGAISFCYIDGNHTYEFARRDFENTDRWLDPGGFILFDDSADGSGWEVCDVVNEVLQSGRYERIANNPNYLVRKL
jgi:hypothetical protein